MPKTEEELKRDKLIHDIKFTSEAIFNDRRKGNNTENLEDYLKHLVNKL